MLHSSSPTLTSLADARRFEENGAGFKGFPVSGGNVDLGLFEPEHSFSARRLLTALTASITRENSASSSAKLEIFRIFGERGQHYGLALVGERLPNFLGDEGA